MSNNKCQVSFFFFFFCLLKKNYLLFILLWTSQVAKWVKNTFANAKDTGNLGLIPGLGRSPGGGNGNTLQYSFLKNPMDRGACQVSIYGVAKSWT